MRMNFGCQVPGRRSATEATVRLDGRPTENTAPLAPAFRSVSAHRLLPGALIAALAACGGDPPAFTVEVVVGQESDALHRAPAVVRVDVTARSVVSDFSTSASAAPGGSFDLGEIASDELLVLEATGVDGSGAVVVRGRSLSGIAVASSPVTVPLFVQRVGSWARPSGGMEHAHVGAPAVTAAERFLMSTGGAAPSADAKADPLTTDFYDLLANGGATSPAAPLLARTLVARGDAVLLVGDDGGSVLDLAAGTVGDVDAPTGLAAFGDVAGGHLAEATEGRTFVVGATRAVGDATQAVLTVGSDGTLGALGLGAPRAGAAAAWVADVGLVVAGGSADRAGLIVLADGATTFTERDFPPDATVGAAAGVTQDGHVLLLGGADGDTAAPARLVDPRCTKGCTAQPVDLGAAIPLRTAQAWSYPSGRILVVGDDADGATRTFVVDPGATQVDELALREPRRGATALPTPNGLMALVGGEHHDGSPARSVELLWLE